jgi:hypothetical protein
MSTNTTPLDPTVNNLPKIPVGTGEAIGDRVRPEDWLSKYKTFNDLLSLSYRKRAEALGFMVEPKEVAALRPIDAPIRCFDLTRSDSIHSWQIIEANMYIFLDGWEAAMKLLHEVPFFAQWEAP